MTSLGLNKNPTLAAKSNLKTYVCRQLQGTQEQLMDENEYQKECATNMLREKIERQTML